MTRPSPGELLREAAALAHGFGWTLDAILDLEHPDRRTLLDELHVLTHHE
jgi:hypothetical protein